MSTRARLVPDRMRESASSAESPAAADLSPRLFVWAGVLLAAAAALIRGLWLGRPSYWIDEINIIRDAMNPANLAEIYRIELERFQSYRGVPFPLFVLRLFLNLLGFHGPYPGSLPPEWAPRLLSWLSGLAAIPILGALGREAAGRRVGVWAMFLCVVSVFHAWYSRDVRVYGLMATLLAGTLWTGVRLVREPAPSRHWWAWAALYAALASAYLQSALNTVFVLAPWSVLILLATIVRHGPRTWFSDTRRVMGWLLVLVFPFLLFSPFLLRLAGYNIQGQVDEKVVILSWRILPALLGRMGWGEAWFALLPFSVGVVWGAADGVAAWRRRREAVGILFAIQGLAVLAFQSAAQWLSGSMFEIRYYMGLYPVLLILAAVGLERFAGLAIWRRLGGPWVVRTVVAVLIAGWALPNLWLVLHVRCQGFCNYKAIAAWINDNVPPGGVYAFYNIYEVRGVPMTYDTPDRTPTSVAIWSGVHQYRQVQPALRAVEFFRAFPEIPFIEIGPVDVLRPDQADAFIPRETLFARQEWIEDPALERLVRLRTCPLGGVQFYNEIVHRILVSWNRPEDLPDLAKKNGRRFYHRWGPEWRYGRDQQARHWMASPSGGTLILGNVVDREQKAVVVLKVLSPGGCRLNVVSIGDTDHADRVFDLPAGRLAEVTVRNLTLKSGVNTMGLQAVHADGTGRPPHLYVNDIRVE